MARICSCVVVLTLLIAHQAHASTIVPGALTGTEGNSNNGYPFNLDEFGHDSMRYQQVYGAAEFLGSVLITGISFRPDWQSSAFSSTLSDIQINLSTTAAAVDGLSSTFASNVGLDDTIVYARGALSLSSAFTGPAAGPKDFDIFILFTTPFLYNPALGNLLLDVRNFGAGDTTQFDAHLLLGDSISRLFATDVTAAAGGFDSSGLVTQFETSAVAAVPEPTTAVLFSVGALGIAARRRWQARLSTRGTTHRFNG